MATSKSMPRTLRLECFAPGQPWGQWQTVEDVPQPATDLVEKLAQFSQFAGGITPMGGLTGSEITLQMPDGGANGPSLTGRASPRAAGGGPTSGRKRPSPRKPARKKARRPARRGGR
jgi:hypothetical protein